MPHLQTDITDKEFDSIYPTQIRKLTNKHWTPISVAKVASEFLANRRGIRVLDIGSGVGKFCIVGALNTRGHFTGVEQRQDLVALSQEIAVAHNVDNVNFIHGNITSINFNDYDAFYLYNSFFENIDTRNSVDDDILLNTNLYYSYSIHTFNQLERLPSGARLATYFTAPNIIPPNFRLVDTQFSSNLNLWEKVY